jgi:thiosulfate/3-mercaptopyruvate sulfurtransferase
MTWHLTWALALTLGAAGKGKQADRYPRADLLIEARELAKPQAAKKYRILDVRPPAKYKEGHIPHARPVDTPAWHKEFTARQDKKTWENRLGRLGIDADTPVVVYGDDPREAARVWWVVRYWGVRDVRLLNGGWTAWKAAGDKVARGEAERPSYAPKKPKLTPLPERLARKDQLRKELKNKRVQIADARSGEEYSGGFIPGARRLEWKDLLDAKTRRFKSPGELNRLFQKAGIDPKKPTVCYCQSGGRAAVLAFALELMGARDARNYYRSWAEWGSARDTEVEKPKARK